MADSIESSRLDFRVHSMERIRQTRRVEGFREEEEPDREKQRDGDETRSESEEDAADRTREDRYERESLDSDPAGSPVIHENRQHPDEEGPGRIIDIVV